MLQIVAVVGVVTTGVGCTVTVAMILNAEPTQPSKDVGTTRYSTVPELTALGLLSVWLMRLPVPALAPVMPPTIVPTVHVNVPGVLAERAIFGLPPLQIAAGGAFVTAGVGCTVTVITYGALAGHAPDVETGVTKYSTVPTVLLLGLLNVCEILFPVPADAPVIPPVIFPMVQLKLLGAVALNGMFVVASLQIAAVDGTPVIVGVG